MLDVPSVGIEVMVEYYSRCARASDDSANTVTMSHSPRVLTGGRRRSRLQPYPSFHPHTPHHIHPDRRLHPYATSRRHLDSSPRDRTTGKSEQSRSRLHNARSSRDCQEQLPPLSVQNEFRNLLSGYQPHHLHHNPYHDHLSLRFLSRDDEVIPPSPSALLGLGLPLPDVTATSYGGSIDLPLCDVNSTSYGGSVGCLSPSPSNCSSFDDAEDPFDFGLPLPDVTLTSDGCSSETLSPSPSPSSGCDSPFDEADTPLDFSLPDVSLTAGASPFESLGPSPSTSSSSFGEVEAHWDRSLPLSDVVSTSVANSTESSSSSPSSTAAWDGDVDEQRALLDLYPHLRDVVLTSVAESLLSSTSSTSCDSDVVEQRVSLDLYPPLRDVVLTSAANFTESTPSWPSSPSSGATFCDNHDDLTILGLEPKSVPSSSSASELAGLWGEPTVRQDLFDFDLETGFSDESGLNLPSLCHFLSESTSSLENVCDSTSPSDFRRLPVFRRLTQQGTEETERDRADTNSNISTDTLSHAAHSTTFTASSCVDGKTRPVPHLSTFAASNTVTDSDDSFSYSDIDIDQDPSEEKELIASDLLVLANEKEEEESEEEEEVEKEEEEEEGDTLADTTNHATRDKTPKTSQRFKDVNRDILKDVSLLHADMEQDMEVDDCPDAPKDASQKHDDSDSERNYGVEGDAHTDVTLPTTSTFYDVTSESTGNNDSRAACEVTFSLPGCISTPRISETLLSSCDDNNNNITRNSASNGDSSQQKADKSDNHRYSEDPGCGRTLDRPDSVRGTVREETDSLGHTADDSLDPILEDSLGHTAEDSDDVQCVCMMESKTAADTHAADKRKTVETLPRVASNTCDATDRVTRHPGEENTEEQSFHGGSTTPTSPNEKDNVVATAETNNMPEGVGSQVKFPLSLSLSRPRLMCNPKRRLKKRSSEISCQASTGAVQKPSPATTSDVIVMTRQKDSDITGIQRDSSLDGGQKHSSNASISALNKRKAALSEAISKYGVSTSPEDNDVTVERCSPDVSKVTGVERRALKRPFIATIDVEAIIRILQQCDLS